MRKSLFYSSVFGFALALSFVLTTIATRGGPNWLRSMEPGWILCRSTLMAPLAMGLALLLRRLVGPKGATRP